MQAIDRQPRRLPYGALVHCERHRSEQTPLNRLVQQLAATFFAKTQAAAGSNLPQFVRGEPDALLQCGTLADRCDGCDGPRRTLQPGLGILGGRVFENPALHPQSFTGTRATLTEDHPWHRWR